MKILLTGANGFIGSNLIRSPLFKSHDLISLSSSQGDIATLNIKDLPKTDHVIHLAAATFVPDSWEKPYDFYHTNVMGTNNILEYCRTHQASLTFLSSYSYGTPQYLPIDELHPHSLNTPYNHSKFLAEELCRFYANQFKVKINVLKPFNIFGEGQKEYFVIPKILKQLLNPETKEIEVFDLTPKRDYLYIDDLISAIHCSLACSGHEIFNVGSGVSYSIQEIIELACKITKINKPIRTSHNSRKNEIMNLTANYDKIATKLGWKPTFSFENGLRKIIESLRSNEKN